MKSKFRHILFSKYSLLVLSAILFALSFIFSKLYTGKSFVSREGRIAEKYLAKHQRDFNDFTNDTALVRLFVDDRESKQQFDRAAAKSYVKCLYTADDFGGVKMKFWSNNLIVPTPDMFVEEDGEYFLSLANGSYLVLKKTLSLPNYPDRQIHRTAHRRRRLVPTPRDSVWQ